MKNQSIRFSSTLLVMAMALTCRPACAQNATPNNEASLSSAASREQLNTALLQAVRSNNLRAVEMLLAHKADANFRTQDGSTPLAILLLHKMDDVYWRIPFTGFTDDLHDPVFQTLIDHGADLKVKRNDGTGLLTLAVQEGCMDYARFLLTQGADINVRKQNGVTPLLAAVRRNKTPIVRFLLANGADPNIAALDGATPLREGVNQGNFAIVEMLLKNGANPSVPSSDGQTPRQVARKMKLTALVNLLTTNGAKE